MAITVRTKHEDIEKMLVAETHIGSKNCDVLVEPYVWKRRISDGTWA